MNKKYCIIVQVVLLVWFFLDMTGVWIGDNCLVTCSYKEDGILFLIYFATILLFIFKEKIGSWIVCGWLTMWFITQFLSHEWYTIFGNGFMGSLEGKIKYFSGTIQIAQIDGVYIPDLYHTVLHFFIIVALICTIRYMVRDKE